MAGSPVKATAGLPTCCAMRSVAGSKGSAHSNHICLAAAQPAALRDRNFFQRRSNRCARSFGKSGGRNVVSDASQKRAGPKPHWLLGNLPEFRRDEIGRRFRFERIGAEPLVPLPSITLPPNKPLDVILHART